SAGDFNNDAFDDIMIGSPAPTGTATGQVNLIYGGQTFTSSPVNLSMPATFSGTTFLGASAGAQAGYSMSVVGRMINNYAFSSIAIGSPGFNNGQGAVYLIPGRGDTS